MSAAAANPEQQELCLEFYEFCRKGDAGRVRFYLKAGLSAAWCNKKDRNRSLLMAAAWKDSVDVCKQLIDSATGGSALIDHQDDSRMTALHICAKQNSIQVAGLLLKRGANPNLTADNEITPLMVCADLGYSELGRLLADHPQIRIDMQSSRGFTALMKAVFENSEQLAETLINKGARLDLSSKGGFTVLHLCAQLDRRSLANKVLEKCKTGGGPDQLINMATRPEFKGNTAFGLAALNGHAEMLELLKVAGANILHRNSEGCTAIDLVNQIGSTSGELLAIMKEWYKDQPKPKEPQDNVFSAVRDGKIKLVERFLTEAGASAADPDPKTGRTLLMLAVAADASSAEMAELLLNRGADVNSQAADGSTALQSAVQKGSEDLVKLLLSRGARVDLQDTVSGSNPLHLCAECDATSIATLLLEKAKASDLQALNKAGHSAVDLAAIGGNVGVLRLLLDSRYFVGGDVSKTLTKLRDLAKKACQFRAVDVVTEFMQGNGTTNATELAVSKLFRAAMDGDTAAVEKLLGQSNSNINAKCPVDPGWTALMAAAWNDNGDICKLLLDRGADPNVKATQLEITALHIAVQQNSRRVAEMLLGQKSIDLNVQSADKRTPLIRAAWLNHCDIGKMLLERRANVNVQELEGFSAMHFCAQENLTDFANLLVGHDADLELQTISDKNSNTAFTLAAIKGHVEMLELLANVGADVYHRSNRGDSMDLAKRARRTKAIEVLRRLDFQRRGVWQPAEASVPESTSSEVADICTDANVTQPPQQLPDAAEEQSHMNSSIIPPIRGSQYSMKLNPRGICVIINNYKFPDPKDDRLGSPRDMKELTKLFGDELKFRVQVHQNLDACDMRAVFKSLATENRHIKFDCFVAFVMTHGQQGMVQGSDGSWVPLKDLYDMFRRCRSLEGKPKLFFLQACRTVVTTLAATEANVDAPSVVDASQQQQQADAARTCSDQLDFLFAYAITEGDYALRDTRSGSLYIQTLCRTIAQNYKKCHLCTMFNMVRSELGKQQQQLSLSGRLQYAFNLPSETTQLQGEVWFRDAT